MKILATLTLILALAVSGLGYMDYRQAQDINLLYLRVSALDAEVQTQHQALLTHKKAILGLRSDEKKLGRVVVGMFLYLKDQDSPKSEQNSYVHSNDLRIQ